MSYLSLVNLPSRSCFLLLCLLLTGVLQAQKLNNTLYMMPDVPQRNMENPAFRPSYCKGYFSIPIIGSIYSNYTNSAVSLAEITNGSVSLFDFKADSLNFKALNTALGDRNYLSQQNEIGIISIGWAKKEHFFSIDLIDKTNVQTAFDNDVIQFLDADFDRAPGRYELGTVALDGSYYRELALGYNRKLRNDFVTIGVKAKVLFGVANVHTKNTQFAFDVATNSTNVSLASNQEIYTSGLVDDIVLTPEGTLLHANIDENKISGNGLSMNTSNLGFGLDLGISMQASENTEFYASVVDLGFINWESEVKLFRQNSSIPMEIGQSSDPSQSDYTPLVDVFEQLADSVKLHYEVDTITTYKTYLPIRAYLGGHHLLSPKVRLGGVFRFDGFRGAIRPAVSVSANYRASKYFNATASYTIHNNSYNNIGIGLSSKLGPLQLYLISDNVPALFALEKAKNTNVRFGINYYFGCDKDLYSRGRRGDDCDYNGSFNKTYRRNTWFNRILRK